MSEVQTAYDALHNTFHEPNRLAIVSALCATEGWLPFTDLRDQCGLTDGNLNRHLKVLEDNDVIRVRKRFVDDKPRTEVAMSNRGLGRFSAYLAALEQVLGAARKAVPTRIPVHARAAWRAAEA